MCRWNLLQHHGLKASILWRSAFFTVQLSHPYMTTGKTIALTRRTFVGKVISHVQLFGTPWPVAHQLPPSMGFSRQEYWSELPFPSPGDLSDPGIEPGCPTLQADALPSAPPEKSKNFWLLIVNFSLIAKADFTVNDVSVSRGMTRCKNWDS